MRINSKELESFLAAVNKRKMKVSLGPGLQEWRFEEGELAYHEICRGERNFIGEGIVFQEGIEVWGMNYYSYVLYPHVSTEEAYAILRPALMQDYKDILSVRGPRFFRIDGKGAYANSVQGTFERFTGTEEIMLKGKTVYRCMYHGGSIT